jgi:neurofibromin 1
MSLVTATAFQQSPAVQTRSFVVLAALAVQDVDDDLLYQILVAFRNVLGKADETNTMVIVSMLRCLCRVVPAVVGTSRYICLLFWLAIALLQVSHLGFYVEATWLLRVTLENMEHRGLFKTKSVETVLLEAREHIDDVMSQLDDMLRISFIRSFSFSLASIIFKGMRHSTQKESAEAVLRTLLRVTSRAHSESPHEAKSSPCAEAMGYFIALLPASTTRKAFRKLLTDANVEQQPFTEVTDSDEAEKSTPIVDASILGIEDPELALLTASFIGTMLATAQGNDAETEILYSLLSTLTKSYPDTITMM